MHKRMFNNGYIVINNNKKKPNCNTFFKSLILSLNYLDELKKYIHAKLVLVTFLPVK